MDAIAGVLAVALTSVVLLYFGFNMSEEEHPLFRLILILFGLLVLLVMPKVFVDASTTCEAVVNSSVTVDASTVGYTYVDFCRTDSTNTSLTFMRIIYWMFRIVTMYMILFIAWKAIEALMARKASGRL